MDLILHRYRNRILEALRTRLPKVPRIAPAIRLPRWGALLPIALILGIWAHRGSSEEGRIAWLRSNAPSDEVWNAVLDRKGFRPVEDPEWKEKAYVEMPEASRKLGSALLSEDLRTIAVRSGGEWRFFQLGRSDSGKAYGEVVRRELWMPMGLGWEALSTVDRTEFPKFRTRAKGRNVPSEWEDPRRISY